MIKTWMYLPKEDRHIEVEIVKTLAETMFDVYDYLLEIENPSSRNVKEISEKFYVSEEFADYLIQIFNSGDWIRMLLG